MNQQTANPSFTNNSSATNPLSPAVTPETSTAAPKQTPLTNAAARKSQSPTTVNARKSALANKNDDRCRHYTVAGRRCRHTVLDRASGLCFRHVARQFQPTDEDLSPAFAGLLSGFQSASRIHGFLTQLTVLLVQNRISTRRAAILAYLGQTLLRTLPAIEQELEPAEPQIIFDLPRPKRDWPEGTDPEVAKHENWDSYLAAQKSKRDDISPERAYVNRMSELHTRCKTPVAPDGYDGWSSDLEKSK